MALARVGLTLILGLIADQSIPLEATHWKATELGGKPVPALTANREAHLMFHGGRVSGSDGCNRIAGSYDLKGDRLTFGQLAGTQMACADSADIEQRFRAALESAAAGRSSAIGWSCSTEPARAWRRLKGGFRRRPRQPHLRC